MSTSLKTQQVVFALDCPDARALADFYARLLGWQIGPASEDWMNVVPPEGTTAGFHIACQQIDDYRAPEWPTGSTPQQAHMDFTVESIAESEPLAIANGAIKHTVQPSDDGQFAVFTDPAGHPFCLCQH
ncbi:VOC family protein [Agrococcus casei]|uniref:VOC family protein n=1 Tax=Agrococcus casei TaxID=343512 RepID=UPI003F91C1EC